jgi:hypothetical protein
VPELDGTGDHGLYTGSRTRTFDQRFLADHMRSSWMPACARRRRPTTRPAPSSQ